MNQSGLLSVQTPRGPVLLPRVTTVLKAFFQMPDDEAAAERGRYVHRALALLLGGDDGSGLDRASLDPALAPSVSAGEHVIEALRIDVFRTERLIASPKYRYVGHADLLGTIDDRWCVLDWKTGAPCRWHRLQLAAYAQAAAESLKTEGIILYPALCERIVAYLHDDGSPSLASWKGPALFHEDLAGFLAARTLWAWQQNHGEATVPAEVRP